MDSLQWITSGYARLAASVSGQGTPSCSCTPACATAACGMPSRPATRARPDHRLRPARLWTDPRRSRRPCPGRGPAGGAGRADGRRTGDPGAHRRAAASRWTWRCCIRRACAPWCWSRRTSRARPRRLTRRCKRRWTSCARQSRWRYGTRQPLQGAPAAGRRARRRGPRDGRNTDLVPGHERHRAARVPWRTGAGARPAYPRLADVAAPTLVAWGDLDFPHVRERSRHAARTIPGAEAREFVGAGHLPSLEDPAGFAALLDDFILRRAAVG